ncbi:MAG: hypothetical protein LBH06_09600, partial [Rikenellaceae bacterium]|nr:hypothetical protein [Rikenellaceae bacterium]
MKKLNSSLLLKYLDGNCNQDEAEVILSWLDELPDNAEKLFSTEFLLGLLQKERYCRQDELQKAEKRLADTVADRRKAALLQEHGKRRRYLRIVAFAAAVVAIGVMFGLLRSTFRAEEKQITLSVASDEMVKFFLLPDGTRVWLNRSSTL